MNREILYPRVPTNWMTKNGYEDGKTPRISFSETVDGCLIAMSANLEGKEFYVHSPAKAIKKSVDSKTLTSKKQVPDASITKEIWSLEPVKLKTVFKIRVGRAIDTPLEYTYGKDQKAELYGWNWKKI